MTYNWNEKRYNEIALNRLVGVQPDSVATADLRQIAQTCLRYGGRAVLGARGLCEVMLKEYYDEGNCDSQLQERSAEDAAQAMPEQSPALLIVPNPAQDVVRISMQGSYANERQVQIFSADGQQVYEGKLQPNEALEIPVTNWRNGFYVAKVTDGAVVNTRSFIIQHP